MAAGKESRARSAKEAAKSAVSPPGSSCGEPGAGPQLLTSGEVALQLLRGERRGGGAAGSSSLPSSPGSVRRGRCGPGFSVLMPANLSLYSAGSNGGGSNHGGSLNNLPSGGRGGGGGGGQERRGSRGIIKPRVARPVLQCGELDHLHAKVGYSNYNFYDSCARPGFVFIGSSGHVIAECAGHPTNTRVIVRTVRDAADTDTLDTEPEEDLDEEKIYASQKLRTISLKLESLKD